MKRGPKPAPTALKLLRGERADRLNPTEPTAPSNLPPPPEHLDEAARAEWHRLGQILEQMRVLQESDTAALALYCSLYSRWRKAEAAIRRQGMVIATATGSIKVNPHVGIAQKAQAEMVRLLAEFGCTPSSRSRIVVPEKPRDALADFLAG